MTIHPNNNKSEEDLTVLQGSGALIKHVKRQHPRSPSSTALLDLASNPAATVESDSPVQLYNR